MKAYLETTVVTQSSLESIRSVSVSQIELEFARYEHFANFRDNDLNTYEKGPGFEIFRTLIPMM